jgi:hypothetical protein
MPITRAISIPEPPPAKDYKIPAALIAIGICIELTSALLLGGPHALTRILVTLPLTLLVQIAIGIAACLITSKIMGTAFGYAGSAILKLAAVFLFPAAVAAYIPVIGWIVSLLLYWGLLEWLFELDVIESLVFVFVIWATSAVAALLITAILVAR